MLIWAILIIIAVWLIVKYSRNQQKTPNVAVSISPDNKIISEETVYERQHDLEKKFEETYLPDRIRRNDIYIYRNLMSQWFIELSAKYRYDEKMTQQLRRDFMDYMYTIEHWPTAQYLSFELEEDDESKESYKKEARTLGQQSYVIENSFAMAMGDGAIEKLEKARNLGFSQLNANGQLAPKGFIYNLEGELVPKTKKSMKHRG